MGGREFKPPGKSAPAAGDADADAGSNKVDPRIMSLRMRSRKEAQSAQSQDPAVQKLLQSGNKDPHAYAKAISESKQPRNALLGDIKDVLGPEFADKVSEALVVMEQAKGDKDAGDGKDGGDDGGGDDGGDDKAKADLPTSDNFGGDEKSPGQIDAKAGDDDNGVSGYADGDKGGLQVHGKKGALSGDLGVEADGKGGSTISGTADISGDAGELQASGSYSDKDDMSGNVAGSMPLGGGFTGKAGAGYQKEAGKDDTVTGMAGAQYDGDKFAASAEVDVAKQGDQTSATAKGSATAKLADGKLYATLTGSATMGGDPDAPKFNLGGQVTLTVSDHAALVAAGAMDEKGGIDLSLELDVLKDKIKSAGDVDDAKKDAILSVFAEYKKGGDGADSGDQVTGGLKLSF
jgi:hypothetical protein